MSTLYPAREINTGKVYDFHADVLVYRVNVTDGCNEYARRDTVKTIGRVWFTLTGERDKTRYTIARQEARGASITWNSALLRVVPLSSNEAHRAAARYRAYRYQRRGELAVRAWQQHHNADTLQAAIDALTTIRDLPPIPEETSWLR